jgi:hypothetical protein
MRRISAIALLPLVMAGAAAGQSGQVKVGKGAPRPAATKGPAIPPPPPPRNGIRAVSAHAVNPVTIRVGEDDWRFADPASAVIGGINIEALAQSPLVRSVVEEVAKQLPGGEEAYRTATARLPVAPGLRRITFALRGGGAETDGLALITGRVDTGEIGRLAQGRVEIRRLDAENILVGTPSLVQSAVRRLALPARPESALIREGRVMAASGDAWLAGSADALAPSALGIPIRQFSLALRLQQDFRLDASVEGADASFAQDILKKAEESRGQLPEGAAFSTSVEGSTVRVSFFMDGAGVRRLAAGAWTGRLHSEFGKQMEKALNWAPALAGRPEPAQPKIVIHGLEDGPREVPFRAR